VAFGSAPVAKSHPPAPGERVRLSWVKRTASGGLFEPLLIPHEIRIAVKVLKSKSRGVE
jgi:hypothetical protein